MPSSYFLIKAFTTAALLFFAFNLSFMTNYFAIKAIDFVWAVKIINHEDCDSEDQDSAFEDPDTEQFPLPDKCPSPPPYEPPPPPYENN